MKNKVGRIAAMSVFGHFFIGDNLSLFAVFSCFKPNHSFIGEQCTQAPKSDVVGKVNTLSKCVIFVCYGAAGDHKADKSEQVFHGGSLIS